jgi:hypothetical protein
MFVYLTAFYVKINSIAKKSKRKTNTYNIQNWEQINISKVHVKVVHHNSQTIFAIIMIEINFFLEDTNDRYLYLIDECFYSQKSYSNFQYFEWKEEEIPTFIVIVNFCCPQIIFLWI